MSVLPTNYVPANEEDPNAPSKYFQLKKLTDGQSTTIRLCGTASSGHCIAGYQYFTMEGRPRRFPLFPRNYLDDIGLTYEAKRSGGTEKGVPSFFLAWVCKRKEVEGYQVFDISQQKVREAIEAILGIEDYTIADGEMANFYLTIARKGMGTDTKYTVTPVLKAPTAAESKHWRATAGSIWLPALFEGGDPFEGRPTQGGSRPTEPLTTRDSLGADEDLPLAGDAAEEESADLVTSGWD